MEAVSLKLKPIKIKHSEEIKDQSEDRVSSTVVFQLEATFSLGTLREIRNLTIFLIALQRINIGISTAVKLRVRGTILRAHYVGRASFPRVQHSIGENK